MRIKKLSSRQVFLGIGAAVAVVLAGTDVSTAQKLRSSDIVYPTLHWELLAERSRLVRGLLDKARAYAAASGSSAVMIVHHGRVIAEWGDTSHRTDIASVRKSLGSIALTMNVRCQGEAAISGHTSARGQPLTFARLGRYGIPASGLDPIGAL